MSGKIHLDSLYLVMKYPKLDAYKYWYPHAEHADHRSLQNGIMHGDFVIKGGASCYKVSVWQHDARAFFTDQVDEKVGENKGSGVWLQLGPMFLIENANRLHAAVKDFLHSVKVDGEYPVKVNRLDLSMDLFGVNMKEQRLADWQQGWVGRSKVSDFHFNSRTGDLETIYIGSRSSAVFLRVYDKVAEALSKGNLPYWIDVWNGYEGDVARIEWVIKPDDGNFSRDLQDFSMMNGFTIRELLFYLLDWGKLCIPNPNDSNNRRWEETYFWKQVREVAQSWLDGVEWPLSRYGKEYHGISDGYINFFKGTLSGAMARFGLEKPNLISVIEGLEKKGHSLEQIQNEALRKAEIIHRL